MPRHRMGYDDDVAEAKDDYDYDDGYNKKAHPRGPKQKPKQKIEDSISIPADSHGLIIGPRGSKLRELEDETMCQIDIPKKSERSDTIWIAGYAEDIEFAKRRLKEIVKESIVKDTKVAKGTAKLAATGKNEENFPALGGQEDVVLAVDVEKFAHGKVIGTGGTRLRDLKNRLKKKEGAASSFNVHAVEVVIPDRDDTSSIISIHLPQSIAASAEEIVRDFFSYYEITEHLLGIQLIGDASMKGDNSSKGKKVAKSKLEGKGGEGGGGGKKGKEGRGGGRHVDPSSPPTSGGMSRESSSALEKAVLLTGSNTELHTRKSRFAKVSGPVVDRVATHGFTHAVLPQRSM